MATIAPERPEILSEPEGLYEVIDGRCRGENDGCV